MDMQLSWWKIIQPELTMFKFRLPWREGQTEYPKGDIYLQPFVGPTSTETRLIVKKGASMIKYDHTKYEEQCYYHNTVNRIKWYPTIFGKLDLKTDGIDNCYDCVAFIQIIENYLAMRSTMDQSQGHPTKDSTKGSNPSMEYKEEIKQLINEIQLHTCHPSRTIYDQTIKAFDDNLNNIYIKLHVFCDNNKCPLYCQQRKKDPQWFVSQQKIATHLQRIIKDAQKIKHNKSKFNKIQQLKKAAIQDVKRTSEMGLCEKEQLKLID